MHVKRWAFLRLNCSHETGGSLSLLHDDDVDADDHGDAFIVVSVSDTRQSRCYYVIPDT